jgi:hypothetical protein
MLHAHAADSMPLTARCTQGATIAAVHCHNWHAECPLLCFPDACSWDNAEVYAKGQAEELMGQAFKVTHWRTD